MEKKGEVLNQLAIISDLVEKVNFDFNSATIIFNLNEKEFENVYNYTSRKKGETFVPFKKTVKDFVLNINDVKIIFNKNSV